MPATYRRIVLSCLTLVLCMCLCLSLLSMAGAGWLLFP